MIQRKQYIDKLAGFKDTRIIKIITGIRRCGKSTLLELFRSYLRKTGVSSAQIISLNFEEPENGELTEWEALYGYIKKRLLPNKKNYIFLDEIQHVHNYERAINGLFVKKNTDLYLTGSNAYMLSSEIATLLSGRYIEIPMLPLSFREYCSAVGRGSPPDPRRLYREYLANSSFPYTLELGGSHELIRDYLGGIYHTIILKDVVARKKISNVFMLESMVRFLFDNIGNISSTKKISDTMTSMGRRISVHTVEQYLKALTDSFILYRAGRYDVRGKQHLKTGDKYYLADIGLRYYLLGSRDADHGRMLENTIYLELLRRGYEVNVGKIDAMEIDFVALKEGSPEYYQAALTVRDTKTLQRELASLQKAGDHYPKYLLTLDEDPPASYNGIQRLNALDWLLQ